MTSVFHIINQDSVNKDTEGNSMVHFIVKNHPFLLVVAPNPTWNLLKCKIKCRLLYDFEDEADKKEVTYIKQNPLEYRVLPDNQGARATIEFKISTLSSQHEDSLFKIELICINSLTKTEETIYSEPIRVLSKLKTAQNGGRRKRGFRESAVKEAPQKKPKQHNDDISSSPPMTPTPSPDYNQSLTKQFLFEKLLQLEQQQSKTVEYINSLKPSNEFSTMFENLAIMYFMLSPEQRASSLRRALQSEKGKEMASAILRETGSESLLSPYFVDIDLCQDIMALSPDSSSLVSPSNV